MNEYNKDRRPMELEPFYSRHVVAMTREDLHSKSDIAQELAYRDKQIAGLENDAAIGRMVRLKMTSGNSVPVDRCIVTAAEIDAAMVAAEASNG